MHDLPLSSSVELRVSAQYRSAHPWVIQAIGGFLSAYFMEHPGFCVQRHMDDLESGDHLWLCDVPPSLTVPRLLRRLKEDLPSCHTHEVITERDSLPRFVIDSPNSAD